jgi:N-acetylmuramoyl-L-alanine amidase
LNIVQPNYAPPNGSPAYRELSQITGFVVHHEDGPWDETPLQVDAQHRAQGWCMIGYTWVIGKDGTVYQGRPMNMVPAAAEDYNTASVDVSLTGDFQPGTPGYDGSPTPEQLQSLKDLCVYAHQQIPSIERIIGHRDVAGMENDPSVATACPGQTLYDLLPEIRAYVAARLSPSVDAR